ncbi:hypothetical protein JAAARDRAFT_48869 [Jaapia argillacea MUCL 33604]|uniref:F-box domain-containing protein n=1 Tax=Jaapia argillacea MUCL 33604 TaxID=933084 RepID=A0A067PMM5_9AGAM|nr:hypothetical protein JAAARDRAFT_48869 [Jaapia argillacea MUCL 33604]
MPVVSFLLELPDELVDHVVGYVERSSDLLALALTCCRLKEIIIPDHLKHREMTIVLDDLDELEQLILRPRLARNVRAIVIYHPEKGWGKEEKVVAESRVALALSLMPNLIQFRWDLDSDPATKGLIWEMLRTSCHCLRRLEFVNSPPTRDASVSKIFDLRNLTWIDLILHIPHRGEVEAYVVAIKNFSLGCPSLSHLTFTFDNLISFEAILREVFWPRLEHILLRNISCHPATLHTFLTRHTTIKYFLFFRFVAESAMQDSIYPPLAPGVLPNLQRLCLQHRNLRHRIDPLLQHASWPDLRWVYFSQVSCLSQPFKAFLARHPSIEDLTIQSSVAADSPHGLLSGLLPDTLPRLRSFMGEGSDYRIVCLAGSPLESLLIDGRELQFAETEQALRRVAPTLLSLSFFPSPDAGALEAFRRKVPELRAKPHFNL